MTAAEADAAAVEEVAAVVVAAGVGTRLRPVHAAAEVDRSRAVTAAEEMAHGSTEEVAAVTMVAALDSTGMAVVTATVATAPGLIEATDVVTAAHG